MSMMTAIRYLVVGTISTLIVLVPGGYLEPVSSSVLSALPLATMAPLAAPPSPAHDAASMTAMSMMAGLSVDH